jgi:oxygen-independent coproporphyrinogen-3 oxidase
MRTDSVGLYVHIPFCKRKCRYCDFASFSADGAFKSRYIDALVREIESYKAEDVTLDTVFFGGGTPSLLSPSELSKIMNAVRSNFHVSDSAEITAEINPGTLNAEKADAFFAEGFNRFSIGLQSIHENEQKKLGRIHNFDDFLKVYDLLRKKGAENISVDLMFGIPEQTPASFEKTLDTVIALSPQHISAYGLIIEEGTPFFTARDKLPLPTEDDECDMYYSCSERLSGLGYEHYEISNYALDGRRSRHNMKYWRDEEYIGLGLSAHSYYKGKRYFNPESFSEYFDGLWAKYRRSENAFVGIDPFEYAMLRLRLKDGIDLSEYQNKFGTVFAEGKDALVTEYIKAGFMSLRNGRLSLTDKGFYLSNSILSELL